MERSSFFNSILKNGQPDRVYLAEDFARYFNSFIGNGIFPNPSSGLQIMAEGDMNISVRKGKAWINGYFYENTDTHNIKLESADGALKRIDRIVLRLDLNSDKRHIRLKVKKGEFGNSPVAPPLQRDEAIYELGLADVLVNNGTISISQKDITDTRLSKELCGIVHGVVDQVDTETLFKQYEKWYKDHVDQAEIDMEELKEQFEKDLAEFKDLYSKWFNSFTRDSEDEFNKWFESIKDILDENAAANLLKEIERVEGLIDDIPPVFHDAPQSSIKEDMNPVDFQHGITICSQSSTNSFPTIGNYGVTLTARGANASYAQIFITRHGDVWSRRSGVINEWNGKWYNAKRDIGDLSELQTKDKSNLVNAINEVSGEIIHDTTGSPGSQKLIAGTLKQGFFGEVPASEFIKGDELCSRLGITQGKNQFSNEPWLKFALDGKILFRPKRAIRHSISWNHLDDKNCIYGDRTIEINGVKYKVRLMKGALTDPSKYNDSDRGAKGSEWNRLMLPISIKAKDKSWKYPAYVEDDIPYWGINYTDSDLQVGSGDGRRVWCQEKTNESGDYRVIRGYDCVSYSDSYDPSFSYSFFGFAPVLEVIE